MPTINLSPLQAVCWQTAEDQGHHENLNDLSSRLQALVRLALAHTEVSEVWELISALPTPDMLRPAQFCEELADTAIRLMEMAWCWDMPLRIIPSDAYYPTTVPWLLRSLGFLHTLIDRITQEVKRHGITPQVGPLTQNALECCWELAASLKVDLWAVIETKNEVNKTRPYQYGTPGEGM